MSPTEYLNRFGNLPIAQRPKMRNGDSFEEIVTREIQNEMGKSYEWLDGECWYRGEPIAGRMTEYERRVIEKATWTAMWGGL